MLRPLHLVLSGLKGGDSPTPPPAPPTAIQLSSCPGPARYGHSCVTNGPDLFVFGGIDSSGNYLNDLWRYRTNVGDIDAWTYLGTGATPRAFHCSISYDDKVFIFGGSSDSGDLNTCYVYDISADSWSSLPNAPVSFVRTGCGNIDGDFYFLGGNSSTSNVYRFRSFFNQWFTFSSVTMPTEDYIWGSVDYDESIYYFLGKDSGGPSTNDSLWEFVQGSSTEVGSNIFSGVDTDTPGYSNSCLVNSTVYIAPTGTYEFTRDGIFFDLTSPSVQTFNISNLSDQIKSSDKSFCSSGGNIYSFGGRFQTSSGVEVLNQLWKISNVE